MKKMIKQINKTMCICNPYGYPGALKNTFTMKPIDIKI